MRSLRASTPDPEERTKEGREDAGEEMDGRWRQRTEEYRRMDIEGGV